MGEQVLRTGLVAFAAVLIVLTAPLTVRDPWFAGPLVAAVWAGVLVVALRPRTVVGRVVLGAAVAGSLAVVMVLAVMVAVAV